MTDQVQELEVLFPEHVDVQLTTGEVITIKPLTFGQTLKAMKVGKNLGSLIINASTAENPRAEYMNIMVEGGEEVIDLLAFAFNKPKSWFDDLPSDDGVKLTAQFLEVNFDFFIKKVMPEIVKSMNSMKTKADSAVTALPSA